MSPESVPDAGHVILESAFVHVTVLVGTSLKATGVMRSVHVLSN